MKLKLTQENTNSEIPCEACFKLMTEVHVILKILNALLLIFLIDHA